MAIRPIPEGYHSLTPVVVVQDVPAFIDFLKRAFDAQETEQMTAPDGTIMHAEVRIGDSILMMGPVRGDNEARPGIFNLYLPDVDRVYQKAVAAGATALTPPADQFYGDRSGSVRDPFGNEWWISTHVEDVPHDEAERRMFALPSQ